jgi:hypothetical protein
MCMSKAAEKLSSEKSWNPKIAEMQVTRPR